MNLPFRLTETTQRHLDQIVADQACEGPHLDFKRELPPAWNEAAKHELLADVTAFANAGGGDLLFGVEEDGAGQAQALVPLTIANPDQEVRRIQDIILSLAEPKLPGVQVHAVPIDVGGSIGHAVLIRVPQSWAGPHRVRTNQHFFIREGLRKRQLDIPEIRGLFLRTERQAERVTNFRSERVGKILAGEAPQKLVEGPTIVVHIIPTQAALGLVQINPVPYTDQRGLPILGTAGGMARLNIDGALVVRNENAQGETHGYSQFFRNGFFESTYVLTHRFDEHRMVLPSLTYEQHLIALLGSFRGELDRLGIGYECSVMFTLLQANEVKLGVRMGLEFPDPHQTLFDRRYLLLPDVLVPADSTPENGLKPVFDLVWQSAGFPSSRNYNAAGEWSPRP